MLDHQSKYHSPFSINRYYHKVSMKLATRKELFSCTPIVFAFTAEPKMPTPELAFCNVNRTATYQDHVEASM